VLGQFQPLPIVEPRALQMAVAQVNAQGPNHPKPSTKRHAGPADRTHVGGDLRLVEHRVQPRRRPFGFGLDRGTKSTHGLDSGLAGASRGPDLQDKAAMTAWREIGIERTKLTLRARISPSIPAHQRHSGFFGPLCPDSTLGYDWEGVRTTGLMGHRA